MNLKSYIKDNSITIFTLIITLFFMFFILSIADVNIVIIFFIYFIILLNIVIMFLTNYYKRKKFYNNFNNILNGLDKKYLISELITSANFTEGQLLVNSLYEINKSFHEEINKYKFQSEEFKEYLELWCHEIKTPIATLELIIENNKNKYNSNLIEEVDRIESYVEQVMFYAKSDTLESDYLIKTISLKKVVENVIKRNKKSLLNKNIKIELDIENVSVNSDAKWLEFIINQVIGNSIKYSKDNNAIIKLSTKTDKNNINLLIEDNGIGIPSDEVDKVFIKGFTGSNGHKNHNSTGIGLYLCSKLCQKLEHNICVESELNEKTIITITFPKSSMTNII